MIKLTPFPASLSKLISPPSYEHGSLMQSFCARNTEQQDIRRLWQHTAITDWELPERTVRVRPDVTQRQQQVFSPVKLQKPTKARARWCRHTMIIGISNLQENPCHVAYLRFTWILLFCSHHIMGLIPYVAHWTISRILIKHSKLEIQFLTRTRLT